MEELDKMKVRKDLERWALRVQKADKEMRELYAEISEVYQAVEV